MEQESAACSTLDDNYFTGLTVPMPKKLFTGQQTDTYCQRIIKFVQGNNSCFTMNENGLIF